MKIAVAHPFHRFSTKIHAAKRSVPALRQQALHVVGIQLLSWGWQDYRAKSRGGTDAGGHQWRKLADGTIQAKAAKKFGGNKLSLYLAQAKEARKGRATTARGKTRPSVGAVAIGIDTGRLIRSLDYKFKSQDTEFRVSTKSVTVGVGSTILYAPHFDAKRPIFGPGFLTPSRRKTVQNKFASAYDRGLKLFGGSTL